MPFQSDEYSEPTDRETVGTVAELFAGVGGFRIGLARSGWKTVFSNQWEPSTRAQHASDCYVFNFGKAGHSNVDFSRLVDEHLLGQGRLIPRTDLVVGGFPCQDYSVAKTLSSSAGLEGKKGVLWWDIHRLIDVNRPRYVFLENVDRLLKSPATQRGRDFAIMLRTLGELGYLIEWRVVNAAEYGFPQRRIRVFIVATKTRATKPLSKTQAVENIFRTGVLSRALPIEEPRGELESIDLNDSPELLSESFGRTGERSPFHNSGVYRGRIAFSIRTVATTPTSPVVLGDVLIPDSDVPDEYWIPPERLPEWEYLKGAKNVERTHKRSGTSYKYSEGRMAFPDLASNPSRTILTGEGGSSPSRFKHVIERPRGYRRLVPLELERLNGFPDDWTRYSGEGLELSDARRAFLMGNALVVGLVERVGAILAGDLQSSRGG